MINETIEGTIVDLISAEPIEGLAELLDNLCPECNGFDIIIEGRCTTCLDCGWSKCNI